MGSTAAGDLDVGLGDDAGTRQLRHTSSVSLYRQWERQPWSVGAVCPARDAKTWRGLLPFAQSRLLGALGELEVGEATVTRTLGALIDYAPTDDDRIYLCTQLADEARHVRFFQAYLKDACGMSAQEEQGAPLRGAADYAQAFAPELTRVTASIRARSGDLRAWYRAVVFYHLTTEGLLATTGLRIGRTMARRLKLAALEDGLTHVIRDEARHVSFGLRAAAEGVLHGHAEVISEAHLEAIRMAAWVLVGPAQQQPTPMLGVALRSVSAQAQWNLDIAEARLVKQLRRIGLPDLAEPARLVWRTAADRAIDAYEERWGTAHPIRAAAAKARIGGLPGLLNIEEEVEWRNG